MVDQDIISGLIKGNESLNRQFVGRTDVISTRRLITENIDINQGTLRITSTVYPSSIALYGEAIYGTNIYFLPPLIWGSLTQGRWGETKWSAGLDEVFLLGHATYGVLGQNSLGGDAYLVAVVTVVNPEDTYTERFHNEEFVDAVTTADIVTSSGYCYFDNGELLLSKIIALDEKAYNNAVINVTGLATSNISGSISLDDGDSWDSITFGTAFTNSNTSTDGIKVRFLGSSDCDGSNTYLSKYEVEYAV